MTLRKITFVGAFLLALLQISDGFAASAYIDGALITRVWRDLYATRGPNGRAYIVLDRHFPLPGVCLYSGNSDTPSGWMLEFDVENGAFSSMFALALSAHVSGKSVRVDYDDQFGGGTTCRIIGLISNG